MIIWFRSVRARAPTTTRVAPNWTKGDQAVDSELSELAQVAAPSWYSHSCLLRLLCQHEVQILNPGGYLSFTGDVHPQREGTSHRAPAPTSPALGTKHTSSYIAGFFFLPFNVIDCHQGVSELLQSILVSLNWMINATAEWRYERECEIEKSITAQGEKSQ